MLDQRFLTRGTCIAGGGTGNFMKAYVRYAGCFWNSWLWWDKTERELHTYMCPRAL